MGEADRTRGTMTNLVGDGVRARPARRAADRARGRVGYAVALVWAVACLGLYVWQLIGLAGG